MLRWQPVRTMAILPQPPAFSRTDLKKEHALRRAAEQAAIWQRKALREQAVTPTFSKISRPSNILKLYWRKRELLTPRDVGAAFFALGKLNRRSALRVGGDPLEAHPTAMELRADLAASAPYLPSRELSNALLGAAYMRSADETMLAALCDAAADKVLNHFTPRHVASTVYALGKLQRHDALLMPRLLSRVAADANEFHAIEMALTASGLADLDVRPTSALEAISRSAIRKIGDFGADELPMLLSALSALGWHDAQLVPLGASRLPNLLSDMTPKGLSETAAVMAASGSWIPSALDSLGEQAAIKAVSK